MDVVFRVRLENSAAQSTAGPETTITPDRALEELDLFSSFQILITPTGTTLHYKPRRGRTKRTKLGKQEHKR